MGWPHIDDTAETEVGVVKDPPDQVRAIEGRGKTSRSKVVSAVPVRVPTEAVVGAVKQNGHSWPGGMKGLGGEVKGEIVEARPGREGGSGALRAHYIKGEFGVWEKAVPEVITEVGVSKRKGRDKVVLACPH
jgi:hypothetical protein